MSGSSLCNLLHSISLSSQYRSVGEPKATGYSRVGKKQFVLNFLFSANVVYFFLSKGPRCKRYKKNSKINNGIWLKKRKHLLLLMILKYTNDEGMTFLRAVQEDLKQRGTEKMILTDSLVLMLQNLQLSKDNTYFGLIRGF